MQYDIYLSFRSSRTLPRRRFLERMDPNSNAAGQLAALVESSEDAIISKTLDGIILTWNAGAERLYDYNAAEVIGKPLSILLPKNRQTEETDILERIRNGE